MVEDQDFFRGVAIGIGGVVVFVSLFLGHADPLGEALAQQVIKKGLRNKMGPAQVQNDRGRCALRDAKVVEPVAARTEDGSQDAVRVVGNVPPFVEATGNVVAQVSPGQVGSLKRVRVWV